MANGIHVSSNLKYDEDAVLGTATKGTTSNIDFKIPKAGLAINGGEILFLNHKWGDYFKIQVVDVDNILGYGAGFVTDTFIQKKYVHPNIPERHIKLPYAGEVVKDLYLRVVYTSTGTVDDVDVAVNYYLHEEI